MPWSGGVFTRENGPSPVFTGTTVWQQDAAASILIESTRHDFHDQDLADGINATLNTAGQNSPTANINWGGFKITSLAPGTDATTDAANCNQTITAGALNPSTNLLTLTRGSGNITVDLTPLVIGGSTADFAKLSASDNAFQGQAEFGGSVTATDNLILQHMTGGTTNNWTWNMNTSNLMSLRPSVGGMQFNFIRDVADPNGGYIQVNGFKVWDQSQLTAAQIASFLTTAGSYVITGSWNFNSAAVILPGNVTFGASPSGWQTTVSSTVFQLFAVGAGTNFTIDNVVTEGPRLRIGGNRVLTNGNTKVYTSATPTGGLANDIAFVLTGANTGVWANIGGTWTKIAS